MSFLGVMTHNDILRRIRYTFDFDDATMLGFFAHNNVDVTRSQLSDWLRKEEDAGYAEIADRELSAFLNGLIVHRRGRKDGPPAPLESELTNNIIFLKLKIALDLKAEDILAILALTDFFLSRHELSAFFRRTDHKHFRECKDQVLRRFLAGMQIKYRDGESFDWASLDSN